MQPNDHPEVSDLRSSDELGPARDLTREARSWVDQLQRDLQQGRLRPTATYRLQLRPGFGFAEAAELVPYLKRLGVSHLYLSPILTASPGSQHGYDVVDYTTVNPELGGLQEFLRLSQALQRAGMSQIIDLVPNHMGIGIHNGWWVDVLENGPSSQRATYFDVVWQPVKAELSNKVLVPVLGDQYGTVLERGELQLRRDGGSILLGYFDQVFPIAPRHLPMLLRHRLAELSAALGAQDLNLQELESIITQLEKLPARRETAPEKVLERAREKEVAKRRLAALCEQSEAVRAFIDGNIALFNGTPGDPRSFDRLHELLENQAYRLAHWRVAGDEINYRRFFDINALAAIRMEDERVFGETHHLLLSLLAQGYASGLRIDHPDGLYDPTTYFQRLQKAWLVERARCLASADDNWELEPAVRAEIDRAVEDQRLPSRPLFVVAEKILGPAEHLPEAWAVDGTTGYDFMALATGLFVDRANAARFDELTRRFTGEASSFQELCYQKKKQVMSSSMASELNLLAQQLNRLSETNRRTRDFTLNELSRALVEVIALFPVYRTYITGPGSAEIAAADRRTVRETIRRARRRGPTTNASVFDFIRDVILLEYPETLSESERREWLEFTLKLQQITGPVMAKAVEDTTFYCFNRLVALNEVGSNPEAFGTPVETFHVAVAERASAWPGTLNATSTHDTKRSEDMRARLCALSEMPDEWDNRIHRWAALNEELLTPVDGQVVPDRSDLLLFYQTALGMIGEGRDSTAGWPAVVDRIQRYMEKAVREAKVHSSWTNPNAEYEAALRRLVEESLKPGPFLTELRDLALRLDRSGCLSSLALVALKCFAPGVPDIYQGCESLDLSLVDPDNRRPPDFESLIRRLDGLELPDDPGLRLQRIAELTSPERMSDGTAKLLALQQAIQLRRRQPELFQRGGYLPLEVGGPHHSHAVAFARQLGERGALCVVPRLTLRLLDDGEGTISWDGQVAVPSGYGRYQDVVTLETHVVGPAGLRLGDCFRHFPVALWTRVD